MSKRNSIPRDAIELCIFCTNAEATSHEHILANWIHKILNRIGASTTKLAKFKKLDHSGNVIQEDIVETNDATTPILCKTCNNEWGSDIQTNAAGVMKPLLEGKWNPLSSKDINHIITWFTSYDMVREMVHNGNETFTQAERSAFWNNGKIPGKIPDTLTIWMAPIKPTRRPITGINRPIIERVHGTIPDHPNAHITVQEIHNMLFVSFYSKEEGIMHPGSAIYRGILRFMNVKGFILLHTSLFPDFNEFTATRPPNAYYTDITAFLDDAMDAISNKPTWWLGYSELNKKDFLIIG